jgi:RNA polymerase sigma-70 factor (ECF subfamily)
MGEPLTDAQEMARSIAHPVVFTVIFDRHIVAIHRYLERRVGRDGADELAGEVFRIAFERRASYQLDRPNCLPWLYGIAKNLLFKECRRQSRHLRALGRLQGDARWSDTSTEIDARLDAHALWPNVSAALGRLSADERDVVLLVAWEELSYQEVAEALDVPIGTVRSRLHRARGRLRELIGPCGEERDDKPLRAEGGNRP